MSAASGRDQCLDVARVAVVERAGAYGSPAPFFAAVARRWSLTLGIDVTPRQVILCLVDMKLQRALSGGGLDTFADIAGYAACGFELEGFLPDEPRASEAAGATTEPVAPVAAASEVASVHYWERHGGGVIYGIAFEHPIERDAADRMMMKAFARCEQRDGIKLSAPAIWPNVMRDGKQVFYAEAVVIGDAT